MPIIWPTRVMCNGEYDNTVRFNTIKDGKRKSPHVDMSTFGSGWGARQRKGKCANCGFFNGQRKLGAQSLLCLGIVGNFGKKLFACCGKKPYAFHLAMR